MVKIFFTGSAVWLAAVSVLCEVPASAQDYAVDSDVVLESAVREVKSIPRDTAGIVGDAAKYIHDETRQTVAGAAAVFSEKSRTAVKKDAIREIADAWSSGGDVLFRSYTIDDVVGEELVMGKVIPEGDAADVTGFFYGMEFPEGTSAVYRPDFDKLLVRQTRENILQIEDILAEQHSLDREPRDRQVKVETKFIEVSQSALNELGFNWRFDGKYGSGAGLFENLTLPDGQDIFAGNLRTASAALEASVEPASLLVSKNNGSLRWSMIIGAIEQSDDADVLSAPSIVTRDGSLATIQVGRERMVPKSFEVNSANTSIYIEHSDWDPELMGVQLEVIPEIRAEALIDLEIRPKVADMIGYDDYQVSPDDASMIVWGGRNVAQTSLRGRFPIATKTVDGVSSTIDDLYSAVLGEFSTETNVNAQPDLRNSPRYYDSNRLPQHDTEGIPIPELHGQMPYFRIREMETRVTVADGSTVGMGGLLYDKLETYRDKVPVLGSIPFFGRLFRSEGEKSVKRNLLIFVTASQVDVKGRRLVDLAGSPGI